MNNRTSGVCRTFAGGLRLILCGLGLLALLVSSAAAQGSPERRIALVIGNNDYRKVGQLINPVNDASDIAASLERLGFSVRHLRDLDYDKFRLALIEFANAAKKAEQAVLFFAGHGVEIDGKNWLIPVDAELKSELDVYAEAINLETLIDISLMPKILGLVVLDACRNNPFATTSGPAWSTPRSGQAKGKNAAKTSTPAISVGLAPVDVTDNVLVAFAAAAGTVARDGTGRNSPYSGSLLRHVETPKLEINYLFRNVHDDVLKETKSQKPAVYGTLSKEEIYLKETDESVKTAAYDPTDAEALAWKFVRVTNDIATLRRFDEQFPQSSHGSEVRGRIAQLENAEKLAWSVVERQNSIGAYQAFIELYPSGDRAGLAQSKLASLQKDPASKKSPLTLPKPPASAYQLASLSSDLPNKNSESIEKVWDVLKTSTDKRLVAGFAKQYPSLRHNRIPPGSDYLLQRANPTELMLRTADDDDVNNCFNGESKACKAAYAKYPDYVQLQFQLCKTQNLKDCMAKAVNDARKRGYLVSRFTRSEKERVRIREYKRTVANVQRQVGNVVGNVVSNVVSNSVNNAVRAATSAASQAAANAAAAAAARAASQAAGRIPSDMRLKQDITKLPQTHRGFQLYRYRYIGNDTYYVGVLAQEVKGKMPSAVVRGADGYLAVDYDMLGLRFLTLSDWKKQYATLDAIHRLTAAKDTHGGELSGAVDRSKN